MYIQFLIEDKSTEIFVEQVMQKLQQLYPEVLIEYDQKSFKGIGHLGKRGSSLDRKTGKLLNDLPMYLRAFSKRLQHLSNASLFIVLDNDQRDTMEFRRILEKMASDNMVLIDHVFCIAVKEMEAWLLGDMKAIEEAYPEVKKNAMRGYEQDGICDTWEVLANMVCPGGLRKLKKKSSNAYTEIGKAKAEWAYNIGRVLHLRDNISPSFQFFIKELTKRIEAV